MTRNNFKRTSVMHVDIGEHEHEVTIFDSYQIYAVCNKCGMHDWGYENCQQEEEPSVYDFKKKYPKYRIVDLDGKVMTNG